MKTWFLFGVVALVVTPAVAVAQCGQGQCTVGTYGTGGDSSGGRAQGGLFQEQRNGVAVSNSGNSAAGRLNITGENIGSLSGTFRAGTSRGRTTGFFGDCEGLCGDPFED